MNSVYCVNLDKELFGKEAIQEALYEYIDSYFVDMEAVNSGFKITFSSKNSNDDKDLIAGFKNRVIDHQIRKNIEKESSYIQNVITEYAYSSVKKN
jgi:His-Xaa-Ser system protein HxsD